jgi:uncharacterized protein (TIGR02246 family)
MVHPDPITLLTEAVGKISSGDLDAVMGYYEDDAVFVAQPGVIVKGLPAIREAMAAYMALSPTLTVDNVRTVIEAPDITLLSAEWTMTGTNPDGSEMKLTGVNVDVFRRQPDGSWRLAIDNPFGV